MPADYRESRRVLPCGSLLKITLQDKIDLWAFLWLIFVKFSPFYYKFKVRFQSDFSESFTRSSSPDSSKDVIIWGLAWFVFIWGGGVLQKRHASPQILNLQGFASLEKLEFLISMSIFIIILVGYFRDIWLWLCSHVPWISYPISDKFFFALFQPKTSLHCRGTRSTGIPNIKWYFEKK